ncbi:PH and SEC7 domain-containing protein 2 isoform X2 [Gouania willdenowi]|uniref:PH and SEC7 domain-containing protein 2-like n=1 Tax=Gouania willdenowi TaxID=441366 RepID=A0A8C5DCE7_GOUWI|nr:PH and SEC7 domain-containing protein 2-like isoform X2 [Gouania willdenowi]
MEDKNFQWSPVVDSEQEDVSGVWSEKQQQRAQKPGPDNGVSFPPITEQKPVDEAEQWQQIFWPVTPVIGTGFQISSATVQWDMPGVCPEAEVLEECEGASRVTDLSDTSQSLQESETTAEFFKQEREERVRFDLQSLNSHHQWTGIHPQPCADVQEEESRQELLNSNGDISQRKESMKVKEGFEPTHPALIQSLKQTIVAISEGEDEENGFSDVKPEEEQEEPCFRRSWLQDVEQKQTVVNGGTSSKETHNEQSEIIVSSDEEANNVSCLRDVGGPPEQTDKPGLTTKPGTQTRFPDTESSKKNCFSEDRKSPTGPSDNLHMCTDQSGTSSDGTTVQNAENSHESPELTENQEEDCLTHKDRNQRSSPQLQQHREERAAHVLAEESESAEMKLTEASGTPEELHTVCVSEEDTSRVSELPDSKEGNNPPMESNGGTTKPLETKSCPSNRETAQHLAQRLFQLDGIQRADVVKHLDKDNDFSRAVGEEYLKFFDFTGQDLDHALRSFLKVVILIGETQERERVLQHFSCRFHQCNPDSFPSSGSVLSLTCALMLLNTDLHGQHVVKSMSSSKFVSNLDGMNEDGNFSKDLLKTYYNSIKNQPLEWAIDEEELKTSMVQDENSGEKPPLRSKFNPFQDVPQDRNAAVLKQGFLQRKLHADVDGKRTPWGRRGWKTFYGVLKGMVLYLQKDDIRSEQQQQTSEDVVSVHHSLAEPASDYTKKPHVFRLQTADWRVLLFEASSRMEMKSWINRINLVSALHSSPPFPAAVGSQRRFCRPILPASLSLHPVEHQMKSHTGMLESFQADLSQHQQSTVDGRKTKAKDVEEHRLRAEYLQHEVSRYETYMQVLEAWSSLKETDTANKAKFCTAELNLFDKAVCTDSDDEGEGGMKKSHSSPSLELETGTPTIVKVRRNISERRTYRIPRWTKENKGQDH